MVPATATTLDSSGSDAITPTTRQLVGAPALRALSRRGALQSGMHVGCMMATGTVVWVALPYGWLLIPAMALHGVTIVTLFAPMHECVHRTAFASRAANAAVGWIAGVLSFYNSTYYRYFHTWHHRYTQDPRRDPELAFPKAASRLQYAREISGAMFWLRRAVDYPRLALGRARPPFVPQRAQRRIAVSMSAQLLIYLAAVVAIGFGVSEVLYFWFFPALLAQPVLRALLVAEHTGCSQDANGLTNTRTTLAGLPVRLLMWNMPYHAEHHLYPSVPFHQLPSLHRRLRGTFRHVAPGYVAAHREILRLL